MGVFDFLFGKKSKNETNIAQIHASETEVRRKAFEQVMAEVMVPSEVKVNFQNAFLEAHQTRERIKEEEVAITHLKDLEWEWSDFDKWHNIFSEKNKWPYMWEKYPELYKEPPMQPKRINAALTLLTIMDMKTILKEKEIKPRPAPKKRADFEEALKSSLLLKDIQPYVNKTINSHRLMHEESRKIAKCKILAHTLSMTISSLSQYYRNEYLNTPLEWEALDSGCLVEREYVNKFNRGELKGIPPFFPGDRTTLVSNIVER